MILIFQFINVLFHIESFLHPWDKPHLIIVYDPLNVLLKLICWYFVEVFLHVCLSVILVCDFFFLVMFLSGFGIRIMLALKTSLEVFLPLQYFFFLKEFEKDRC